jgi:hypothetical protein
MSGGLLILPRNGGGWQRPWDVVKESDESVMGKGHCTANGMRFEVPLTYLSTLV